MDSPAPARRRSRVWNYEQALPGEDPALALERATERFQRHIGRLLADVDRPVRIEAQIRVVELEAPVEPATTADDGDSANEVA